MSIFLEARTWSEFHAWRHSYRFCSPFTSCHPQPVGSVARHRRTRPLGRSGLRGRAAGREATGVRLLQRRHGYRTPFQQPIGLLASARVSDQEGGRRGKECERNRGGGRRASVALRIRAASPNPAVVRRSGDMVCSRTKASLMAGARRCERSWLWALVRRGWCVLRLRDATRRAAPADPRSTSARASTADSALRDRSRSRARAPRLAGRQPPTRS